MNTCCLQSRQRLKRSQLTIYVYKDSPYLQAAAEHAVEALHGTEHVVEALVVKRLHLEVIDQQKGHSLS